jgi:hypothetical protein
MDEGLLVWMEFIATFFLSDFFSEEPIHDTNPVRLQNQTHYIEPRQQQKRNTDPNETENNSEEHNFCKIQ